MSISLKRTSSLQFLKKKTTRQGSGKYTKASSAGGETYHNNVRAGSTPSKTRRRRKPYRGQGR